MNALRTGGGSHKEKMSRKEYLKAGNVRVESTDKLMELKL